MAAAGTLQPVKMWRIGDYEDTFGLENPIWKIHKKIKGYLGPALVPELLIFLQELHKS